MKTIKLIWLNEALGRGVVGGKAYALNKMVQAGFMVPYGFVVPSATYRNMTPRLKRAIYQYFDELNAPFVAVRSSAVNEDGTEDAWAGQLDTFLNCSRDDIIEKVELCWESVHTDRAKSYAQQKGISGSRVAVIVQEMIDSEVSGVAFSAHPVTGNRQQVVVEAGLGLGEAIVSGEITPDTYVISTNDEIAERHIGNQQKMLVRDVDGKTVWKDVEGSLQKLTDEQVTKITHTVKKLEEYFAHPVDVEWAMSNDRLYILQSRPITTL